MEAVVPGLRLGGDPRNRTRHGKPKNKKAAWGDCGKATAARSSGGAERHPASQPASVFACYVYPSITGAEIRAWRSQVARRSLAQAA